VCQRKIKKIRKTRTRERVSRNHKSDIAHSCIKSLDKSRHRYLEHLANPQERAKGYGTALLDLLPVSRRKPKRDHIFLTMALCLTKLPNSLTERDEELVLIRHAPLCRVSRANSPRAD